MTKLNKSLAAIGILFFFSIGVLSVSFAARGPSKSRLPRYAKSHGPLSNELAQVDRNTVKRGMPIEEDGELPKLSEDFSVVQELGEASLQILWITATSRVVLPPKVSTLGFQSVLNL